MDRRLLLSCKIKLSLVFFLFYGLNSFSQEADRVTLIKNSITASELIKSLESQTDFRFIYEESAIEGIIFTDINFRAADIHLVLQSCSEKSPLDFKINDRLISIRRTGLMSTESEEQVKEKLVEGLVTDAQTGEPLIGATVIVPETTIGVITDADGIFSIVVPPENEELHISYIGYIALSKSIKGLTYLQVSLEPSLTSLDEVVVVGYGTTMKKNTTNAITKIKIEDLDKANDISPVKMMQGRIAGVHINSTSGTPGETPNIMIRGIGSLSGGSSPLYVIDGVPGSIPPINNNDILSIEVLKDASSSAIYGSRANNGVIIITTKKGKEGATKYDFSAYNGYGFVYRDIEVANTDEFLRVHNTARVNHNNQWGLSESRLIDGWGHAYLAPIEDPREEGHQDTNWFDEISRDYAKSSKYSLAVSGGNSRTTFYSSFSANDLQGIIRKSKNNQRTFRLKLDHQVSDMLKFNFNLSMGYYDYSKVLTTQNTVKVIRYSREEQPFVSPYRIDGGYSLGGIDVVRHNPVQTINEMDERERAYRGNGYFDIEFTPLEGLVYKPSINIYGNLLDYRRVLTDAHSKAGSWPDLVQSRNMGSRIVFDNILTYNGNYNKLEYSVMGGHSFEYSQYDNLSVLGDYFPSDSFRWLSSASKVEDLGSYFSEYAIDSYLGRITMNYDNRYIANLAIRRDGSSKFSEGKRYGNFPSASVAWRFSNESFYPRNKYVSDAKLRLSYGVTGSMNGIGYYDAISTIQTGLLYNGESGLGIGHLGQDLTWEKAEQIDIGMDIELFDGRYTLVVDAYRQLTRDLLYNSPIYSTSGYTSVSRNIGTLQNLGLEISATARILTHSIKWYLDGNISFMKNELLSLLDETKIIPFDGSHALIIGKPISSFYVYKQTGIYQYDIEVPKPLYDKGVRAGDVIYEDVNKDGDITSIDRQHVGKAIPDFYGGFTNNFSYKNFELNIFCQYSVGNSVMSWWRGAGPSSGGTDHLGYKPNMNIGKNIANSYWYGPGTSFTNPRPITSETNNLYNVYWSTRFLEDASYLKIKSLTLAYNLPEAVLKRVRLSSVRVYGTVDNALTFTKYTGFDPETSLSSNPASGDYGVDYGDQPILRFLMFGINVSL